MSETFSTDPTRVAMMILSYIERHPNAKDTAQGIAQWWVHQPPDVVERALKILTTLSFMSTRNVRGTGNVYEMAPVHGAQIREWRKRFQ